VFPEFRDKKVRVIRRDGFKKERVAPACINEFVVVIRGAGNRLCYQRRRVLPLFVNVTF